MMVGYIDLSKRRVSPEDITKCEERYMKSKAVASIMRHVASKLPSIDADVAPTDADPTADAPSTADNAAPAEKETKKAKRAAKKEAAQEDPAADDAMPGGPSEDERLERLYEQVAWPLGHKYGHTYDAFKLALTSVFAI